MLVKQLVVHPFSDHLKASQLMVHIRQLLLYCYANLHEHASTRGNVFLNPAILGEYASR